MGEVTGEKRHPGGETSMAEVTEVLSPALGAQWEKKVGSLAELCPKISPRCCGCVPLLPHIVLARVSLSAPAASNNIRF